MTLSAADVDDERAALERYKLARGELDASADAAWPRSGPVSPSAVLDEYRNDGHSKRRWWRNFCRRLTV